MKVLSLFDGISCGMIALERAGINVEKYDAFEIDKYATSYIDGDTNMAILICAYDVDKDTICQCTGLKDKNSKA